MDSRPIGVFDSGLGGLTAVRQLMLELPGEQIIYFGDTGRVPYGTRSAETITKYARQDIQFLLQFDIKAIMIACNTADATARQAIAGEYPVPIFGVAEPSARAAVAATKNEKVGLIGTTATIGTKIYERLMKAMRPTVQVMPRACPLLVPMVENGRIHRGDTVIETLVAEYLQPLKDWGCDTLVLGCTHYPWIQKNIARIYPDLHIINPSSIIVDTIREIIQERDMAAKGSSFENIFYASDLSENFVNMIDSIFEGEDEDARVKFLNFDLEQGDKYEF